MKKSILAEAHDYSDAFQGYLRQLGAMPNTNSDEQSKLLLELDTQTDLFRTELCSFGPITDELLRLIQQEILVGRNLADFFTPSSIARTGAPKSINQLKKWASNLDESQKRLKQALSTNTPELAQISINHINLLLRLCFTRDYLEDFFQLIAGYLRMNKSDNDRINFQKFTWDNYDTSLQSLLQEKFLLPAASTPKILHALWTSRQAVHDLQHKLVESNLKLVINTAMNYRNSAIPLNDLIQEGNIGLFRALEKFDIKLGHKFSTYASWWIRHTVSRAIADQSRIIRIPVHMIHTINSINHAEARFLQEHGREAESEEIAQILELSVARVSAIRKMARQPISLQSPLAKNSEGKNFILEDVIADDRPDSDPAAELHNKLSYDRLCKMLDFLSEREQQIIILRFGLFGNPETSLQDLGKKFNICRERVRQLEIEILTKLRSPQILEQVYQAEKTNAQREAHNL